MSDSGDELEDDEVEDPVVPLPSSESSSAADDDDISTWSNLVIANNRIAARRTLIDAISSVRGKLKPCKFVGPNVGGPARWSAGTRAPDGKIYFAPRSADFVLCVNPVTSTVARFGDSVARFASKKSETKYSDAALSADGLWLFLIPASALFVVRMVRIHVWLLSSFWSLTYGCSMKLYSNIYVLESVSLSLPILYWLRRTWRRVKLNLLVKT
jgi:hypothetical protein